MTKRYAIFNADNTLKTRLVSGLNDIPEGAIEVDGATWMMITQETDGVWMLNGDGSIVKAPLPPVSPQMLAVIERSWRDGELIRVVWLRDRHRDQMDAGLPLSLVMTQFSELLVYIQALRDWPQSPNFPDSLYRPIALPWLADQTQ
ncbi:phage tail assembly chaperone [Pseudomonas brassicacearum]|uniref:phage tail assembly chaperone n=1 Tax=Pseudomonas brassicacearum TaxID=930166 RepID=UPI0020325F68|nr:phage tail assembly chaperone [Pseudomonas brassicacearum]